MISFDFVAFYSNKCHSKSSEKIAPKCLILFNFTEFEISKFWPNFFLYHFYVFSSNFDAKFVSKIEKRIFINWKTNFSRASLPLLEKKPRNSLPWVGNGSVSSEPAQSKTDQRLPQMGSTFSAKQMYLAKSRYVPGVNTKEYKSGDTNNFFFNASKPRYNYGFGKFIDEKNRKSLEKIWQKIILSSFPKDFLHESNFFNFKRIKSLNCKLYCIKH